MQAQGTTTAPPQPPAVSIEDEVLGNLRAQPLGPGTVADLCLDEAYLRRVADRIVRSSFEERWRIVLADEQIEATRKAIEDQHATSVAPSAQSWIRPLAYGAGGIVLLFLIVVLVSRRRRAS